MVLRSDISIDATRFDPISVTSQQNDLNEEMEKVTVAAGRWYEIGAQKYRKLREEGKTPIPGRIVLPGGIDLNVHSREEGRDIPCRLFLPSSGAKPVAIFLHFHGGGWVLQSHLDYDTHLENLANGAGSGIPIAAISVGYRLAPEHPFPAGPEDCYDVAEWLVSGRASYSRFGDAPVHFIGGESAGAHLSVLTLKHLLSLRKPYTEVRGLVLHFGAFSLDSLPSSVNFKRDLVLTNDIMEAYIDAVTPHEHKATRSKFIKRGDVSALFLDLEEHRGHLPPALFTCGTADPLLDDTLLMGTKWMTWGAKNTFIKIYPGQPHGFVFFSKENNPAVTEVSEHVAEFIKLIA